MALSKSTLSGCFDPTLASGFTAFLFVQPAAINSSVPSPVIRIIRRDIRPQEIFDCQFSICNFADSVFAIGNRKLKIQSDLLQRRFGRGLQQDFSILLWIAAAEH